MFCAPNTNIFYVHFCKVSNKKSYQKAMVRTFCTPYRKFSGEYFGQTDGANDARTKNVLKSLRKTYSLSSCMLLKSSVLPIQTFYALSSMLTKKVFYLFLTYNVCFYPEKKMLDWLFWTPVTALEIFVLEIKSACISTSFALPGTSCTPDAKYSRFVEINWISIFENCEFFEFLQEVRI